ncbi:unnamed protein product, partial [Phaeothamnion confervicola]
MKDEKQGQSLLDTCLGSSAAGIVARVFCHPLDTAKAMKILPHARLQIKGGSDFRGTMHVLRYTMAQEGIRGLYRGFGAVVVGGTPGTCLYLTTYDVSKRALITVPVLHNNQFLAHFAAGMAAETVCCVVYVPVDVIKERLQVQRRSPAAAAPASSTAMAASTMEATAASGAARGLPNVPAYTGSLQAARSIVATEGLRGIYCGYGATLLSFGPFSALYFTFYEQLRALSLRVMRPLDAGLEATGPAGSGAGSRDAAGSGGSGSGPDSGGELFFPVTLCNAAAAGALASWITNPLDLAKLRLQVQRGEAATPVAAGIAAAASAESSVLSSALPPPAVAATRYVSMSDGLRKIYHAEGIRGLFRGSGARMAFHAPATAITMAIFEECRRFF